MSSTSRAVIAEYAKRDPDAEKYLKVYDAILGCTKDPKACATSYAKDQLAQVLSNETGIPAADIRGCLDNPQQCAQQQAINYLAAEAGISPEVFRLAAECAKSNDTDKCAKAGLILAANAACTYYTAGAGAVTGLCSRFAPILVDLAWPTIKPLIEYATLGVGLDGLVNILTFGQGLGFILKPLGGALSLLSGGDEKGKFSVSKKHAVFHQAVKMTNDAVNGTVRGLWDAQSAVRTTASLGAPRGDAQMVAWANDRFKRWHEMRASKEAAVSSAQKAYDKRSGDVYQTMKLLANLMIAKSEREFWLTCLAPPWDVPLAATAQTAAREHFYASFMDKLGEFGFTKAAWRQSEKGKRVRLDGGNWFAYGWDNICTSCTQNDVEVFADLVLKLFVENRIARIEPVVLATVDKIVRDIASETPAIAPLAPLVAPSVAFAPLVATAKTALPAHLLTSKLAPKAVTADLTKIMQARVAKPIKIPAAKDDTNPALVAWEWSRANPEYAIPAASIALALVALAAHKLSR
jgi:hypothetical protein